MFPFQRNASSDCVRACTNQSSASEVVHRVMNSNDMSIDVILTCTHLILFRLKPEQEFCSVIVKQQGLIL